MKKLMILLAALTAFAAAAAAQDQIVDLNDFSLSKEDAKIETHLHVAFPMYFGWSTLTNLNYKGAWDLGGAQHNFLDTQIGKNFVYGLEMAAIHFSSADGPLDVSLGLRWTFMDFTLANSQYTFRKVVPNLTTAEMHFTDTYFPFYIKNEAANYDGRKSKIHGNYLGVPLRMTLHYGKARVFVGASAEYLISGYTKYKHPKYRQDVTPMFNRFRATVEGGFYWGILGVFANYSLTPLFPDTLCDAHTFTFGLVLGR